MNVEMRLCSCCHSRGYQGSKYGNEIYTSDNPEETENTPGNGFWWSVAVPFKVACEKSTCKRFILNGNIVTGKLKTSSEA